MSMIHFDGHALLLVLVLIGFLAWGMLRRSPKGEWSSESYRFAPAPQEETALVNWREEMQALADWVDQDRPYNHEEDGL